MQWSTIVAILGVSVTAGTAMWTALVASSSMRQLERITSILRDMPDDEPARTDLLFLQRDLARRVNPAYRAPKDWYSVLLAWILRGCGVLLLAASYVWLAGALAIALPHANSSHGASWRVWLIYAGVGIAMLLAAFGLLRLRTMSRLRWLRGNGENESMAAKF